MEGWGPQSSPYTFEGGLEHRRFVLRNFKAAPRSAKRRAGLQFLFMLFVALPVSALVLTALGWLVRAVI